MHWKEIASREHPAGRAPERGGVWHSPGLGDLSRLLQRAPRPARVLDLGAAEQPTLNFLGGLHVEVQVAALEPDAGGRLNPPSYEDASFQGILAWDYFIRTEPRARRDFARRLGGWLAPGGGILLVLPVPGSRQPWSFRFRVRDAENLEYVPLRPLVRVQLPSVREVLGAFEGLEGCGARVLRHGVAEFFLRRPAPANPDAPAPP